MILLLLACSGAPAEAPAEAPPSQVTGRLLMAGAPLADQELALCSEVPEAWRMHPCEQAALSLETRTDAGGAFAFEDVPARPFTLLLGLEGGGWVALHEGRCCQDLKAGSSLSLGDLDLAVPPPP